MWKDKLWKNLWEFLIPHSLLKTVELPTPNCGKKYVAALRKKTLFHISFPYGSCYYLNLFIYI